MKKVKKLLFMFISIIGLFFVANQNVKATTEPTIDLVVDYENSTNEYVVFELSITNVTLTNYGFILKFYPTEMDTFDCSIQPSVIEGSLNNPYPSDVDSTPVTIIDDLEVISVSLAGKIGDGAYVTITKNPILKFKVYFNENFSGSTFDMNMDSFEKSTIFTPDGNIYPVWDEPKVFTTPTGSTPVTKYEVDFNTMGSNTSIVSQEIESGSVVKQPTNPTKTGYTFTGWYTDSSCENQYKYNFSTPVASSFTLYAGWKVATYTVNYIVDSAQYSNETVEYGSILTAPTMSARDGYTFDGWYTDSSCTNKYSFSSKVTSNLNLYGKYVSNTQDEEDSEYTDVTFELVDVSTDKANHKYAYDIVLHNPNGVKFNEAYVFLRLKFIDTNGDLVDNELYLALPYDESEFPMSYLTVSNLNPNFNVIVRDDCSPEFILKNELKQQGLTDKKITLGTINFEIYQDVDFGIYVGSDEENIYSQIVYVYEGTNEKYYSTGLDATYSLSYEYEDSNEEEIPYTDVTYELVDVSTDKANHKYAFDVVLYNPNGIKFNEAYLFLRLKFTDTNGDLVDNELYLALPYDESEFPMSYLTVSNLNPNFNVIVRDDCSPEFILKNELKQQGLTDKKITLGTINFEIYQDVEFGVYVGSDEENIYSQIVYVYESANEKYYSTGLDTMYSLSYEAGGNPNPTPNPNPTTYTVTFNSNGGSSVETQTVAENTAASQPTNPTLAGYNFTGWYSDSTLNTKYNFSSLVTSNITLYAGWEIKQYTVTFNVDSAINSTQTVQHGSTVLEPTMAEKEGYTFDGWYTNSGYTTKFTFTSKITADITLYGHYVDYNEEVEGYIISFFTAHGDTPSDVKGVYEIPISLPNIVAEGYTFDGWYLDSNYSDAAVAGYELSANITLYAKWIDNSSVNPTDVFDVTFMTGTSVIDTLKDVNVIATSNWPQITNNSYNFIGWYTTSDFQNEAVDTSKPYNVYKDMTFYAKWEKKVSTFTELTFELIESVNSTGINNVYMVEIYLQNPNNVYFDGGMINFYLKYTDKDGVIQEGDWWDLLPDDEALEPLCDISFIANNYTNAYYDSCSVNFSLPTNISVSELYIGTLVFTIRYDMEFGSLYTGNPSGSFISSTYQSVYTTAFPASSANLYFTYDPSGSTNPSYTAYFADGNEILYSISNVTEITPSDWPTAQKENYNFIGWFYNYGADEVAVDLTKSFTLTSNMTFYAIWEEKEYTPPTPITYYTINFNADGGSAVDSLTVEEATVIDNAPVTTRSGYTFLGWYDENDILILFPYTVYSTNTLTAKWVQLENEIVEGENKIILEKVSGKSNTFSIYLTNYDGLRSGAFYLDFGGNASVVSCTFTKGIIASFESNNNCIDFIFLNITTNQLFKLCEIEIESVDYAPKAVVTLAIDEEIGNNDLKNYSYNSLEIIFEAPVGEAYFKMIPTKTEVSENIFTIDLYLYNVNSINITSVSLEFDLIEEFNAYAVLDSAIPYVSLYYNQFMGALKDETISDNEIYLGRIYFSNTTYEGLYNFGLYTSTITYLDGSGSRKTLKNITCQTTSITFTKPTGSICDDISIHSIKIGDINYDTFEGTIITFKGLDANLTTVDLTVTVNPESFVKISSSPYALKTLTYTLEIASGENEFYINVNAPSGDVEMYTVIINRNSTNPDPVVVKMELAEIESGKSYDIYYNGLIGFNVYLSGLDYFADVIQIDLAYDTSIFEFVYDKSYGLDGYTIIMGYDDEIEEYEFGATTSNPIVGDKVYIARVYFKLKNVPSTIGNYEFKADDETIIYNSSSNAQPYDIESVTLTLQNGIEPTLDKIIIKDSTTQAVLYETTSYVVNENGVIEVPTFDYTNTNISVYLTTQSGVYAKINSTVYSSVYNGTFGEEFELLLDVLTYTNDSYTTRNYKFALTRSEGSSDATLASITINHGDNTSDANITKVDDSNYTVTIDSSIKYIDRDDISIIVVRNTTLSNVYFDGLTTHELIKEYTYTTSGDKTINIKVVSQNGVEVNYVIEFTIDEQLKYVIEDENIEELSKIFNQIAVGSNDIILSVSADGNEVTSFTKKITILDEDNNDVTSTGAYNVGTYSVTVYVEGDDDYLQSDSITKEFEISVLVVNSNDVTITLEHSTYEYTGSIIKPTVTSVTVSGLANALDAADYSITYGDENYNVNVSSTLPYVNVKNSENGNYSFDVNKVFEIVSVDLTEANITYTVKPKTYNANVIKVSKEDISLLINGVAIADSEYEIDDSSFSRIEAGTATFVINASSSSNFTGSLTLSFTIDVLTITADNILVTIDAADENGNYSVDYNGTAQKPAITVSVVDGGVVATSNYNVTYSNNTNASVNFNATISINSTNKSISGSLEDIKEFVINQLTIDKAINTLITHDIVSNQKYTGSAITPTPKVYYNSNPLTASQDEINGDYIYDYSDNTNAGTAKITIIGMNNFKDSFDIEFEIEPITIDENKLTFTLQYYTTVYQYYAREPEVSNVKLNGVELSEDKYDTVYTNNINVGQATVTVTLKDDVNYTGSASQIFNITKLSFSDTSNSVYVKLYYESTVPVDRKFTYSSSFTKPAYQLWLMDGEKQLATISSDYYQEDSSGVDYINVGEKKYNVNAVSDSVLASKDSTLIQNYSGSIQIDYEIVALDLSTISSSITLLNTVDDITYDAGEHKPTVQFKYSNDNPLVEGTSGDYTLQYINNIEVGVLQVLLKGYNNYTGECTIDICDIIQETDQTKYNVFVVYTQMPYNMLEQIQTVYVKIGSNYVSANNYDLDYVSEDYINAGIKQIDVIGKNSLSGLTFSVEYEIAPRSLLDENITVDNIDPQVYTASEIKPELVISYKGTILTKSTDGITGDYTLTYTNNTNVGTATITINGLNNFAAVDYASKLPITRTKTFSIIPLNNSNSTTDNTPQITLSQYTYIYSGEQCKPTVTLTLNGITLSCYNVAYDKNINVSLDDDGNVIPGAEVIITGTGNLAGYSETLNFTINPKSITKVDDLGNVVLADGFSLEDIEPQPHTGSEIIPEITLKNGSILLYDEDDYALSGKDNESPTTNAKLTIKGINNYVGEYIVYFSIVVPSDFTVELITSKYTYTGSPITFDHTNIKFFNGSDEVFIDSKYFTLDFTNNTNVKYDTDNVTVIAGAGLTIKFINEYADYGTITGTTFEIEPLSISSFEISGINIDGYVYTGKAINPTVELYNNLDLSNKILISQKDSILQIDNYVYNAFNNIEVTENSNIAFVELTGVNNYTGSVKAYFDIIMNTNAEFEVEWDKQYTYNGSAIVPVPEITMDGTKITGLTPQLAYYEDELLQKQLTQIVNANTYYIVVSISNSNMSGSKTKEFTINQAEFLSSYVVSTPSYSYDGQEKTIVDDDMNLVFNGISLVLGDDYDLEYDKAKNQGTHPIAKITGKGNFKPTILTGFTYKISKADISITANDQTRVYNSIDEIVLNDYTIDGIIYDSEEDLNIELVCDIQKDTYVGEYVITITASNDNYNITLTNGKYTITPATIVLDVDNQVVNWNNTVQMPSIIGTLPEDEQVKDEYYYQSDDTKFTGASEIGVYELYANFVTEKKTNPNGVEVLNYIIVDSDNNIINNGDLSNLTIVDVLFTFEIATPQLITIKEGSLMTFMYIEHAEKGNIYRRAYAEKGYVHGFDDINGNTNGINSDHIILGQVELNTNIITFLDQLETPARFVRITKNPGTDKAKVVFDCNDNYATDESLAKVLVGTGNLIEFIDAEHNVLDKAYISVMGDVNSDGKITAIDLKQIKSYIKGEETSTFESDEFILAVLLRNRGKVDAMDLRYAKQAVAKTLDLVQFFYVPENLSLMSLSLDEEISTNDIVDQIDLNEETNQTNTEVEAVVDTDDISTNTNEIIENSNNNSLSTNEVSIASYQLTRFYALVEEDETEEDAFSIVSSSVYKNIAVQISDLKNKSLLLDDKSFERGMIL